MSKSLGNVYTVSTLIEKGINPLAFKLFCFSSHYRNNINFTFEGIEATNKAYVRLKDGYNKHKEGKEYVSEDIINEFKTKFEEAINDDLNMPMAMGIVWDVIKYSSKSKKLSQLLEKFDEVLGLKIDEIDKNSIDLPEEIKELIEQRKSARENKEWELSDKLRDRIIELGYLVKDTKNGMEVEKA